MCVCIDYDYRAHKTQREAKFPFVYATELQESRISVASCLTSLIKTVIMWQNSWFPNTYSYCGSLKDFPNVSQDLTDHCKQHIYDFPATSRGIFLHGS